MTKKEMMRGARRRVTTVEAGPPTVSLLRKMRTVLKLMGIFPVREEREGWRDVWEERGRNVLKGKWSVLVQVIEEGLTEGEGCVGKREGGMC